MVKHIVKPSVVETYVKEVTGCTDRASLEEWQLGRVREMIRYDQPMEQYVPAPVAAELKERKEK